MNKYALEWKDVSFSVPHGFWMKPRMILYALNLAVPSGTAMGLIGPNGAGKTTTIKLGAGLLKPVSGQVLINGQPALTPGSRYGMGLLTETQYIYPHLKLGEWISMAARLSGLDRTQCDRRVKQVLEKFELADQANQMLRTLSKGQVQRAGLAQAFVHEPSVLLLDEPMSGLDPRWRHIVQKILLDYKASGGSILFSSHIFSDVERISDQVALIEHGSLQWSGRLADLPMKIKGYEIICRGGKPETVQTLVKDQKVERQPDGSWRVSIPLDFKTQFIQLASSGAISIESLRPVQEEIEEILFGVKSKSEN